MNSCLLVDAPKVGAEHVLGLAVAGRDAVHKHACVQCMQGSNRFEMLVDDTAPLTNEMACVQASFDQDDILMKNPL